MGALSPSWTDRGSGGHGPTAHIETVTKGSPEGGVTNAAAIVPGQLATRSLDSAVSIDLASIQSISIRSESLTIAVLYEGLPPTIMVSHGAESTERLREVTGIGRVSVAMKNRA